MKTAITLAVVLCLSTIVVQGYPTGNISDSNEPWTEKLDEGIEALKKEVKALHQNVSALQNVNKDERVAFSAGLGHSEVGQSRYRETVLVFKDVEVNKGNAYDNVTGIFTAPTRGIYYFRFTIDVLYQNYGVSLNHNGDKIMYNFALGRYQLDNYVSNGLAVELQEGDHVYMTIGKGDGTFGGHGRHTTFTGFILFTMPMHINT